MPGSVVVDELSATAAYLLIVMAFNRVKAVTVMPFIYMQSGFATVMSWLVFHHTPDFWTRVGMLIIAVCGRGIAWLNGREARHVVEAADAFE